MLSNPRAERVRRVARLSGRSARQRHRRFVVEGPQGVREAVRHAAGQVHDLYVTPQAAVRHEEIVARAREAGLHVHEGTAEVLDAMSPDAQGVLAVLALPDPPPLAEVLAASPSLVAVLAQVTDPGNAGTVIRAADAAGAQAVVLCSGSVEVTNPKVVRATAGSLFHLPVLTGMELAELAAALGGAGLRLLAADGAGERELFDPSLDLAAPTAWVFGNEAHGLSSGQRDLCDASVRVPLHGLAESLNLATAAAVCLYASARAQHAGR